MYVRIAISDFFPNFNHKFNILNMTKKKLKRLKLVLVEKAQSLVWYRGNSSFSVHR